MRRPVSAFWLFVVTVGVVALTAGWQTTPTAASAKTPGWIGSVTASYDQHTGTTLSLPSTFAAANLLVASVANDGPDSNSTETHATFGGTSRLRWIRLAHVSARQDWAAPPDTVDLAGASSAEVWMARPLTGWTPGTVSEISNAPQAPDDGGVLTIAAWSTGRVGQIFTVDGLNDRPEHQLINTLGPASSIYAAVFNGQANAAFSPLPGFHAAGGIVRRVGDDTAQILASDDRNLPAGIHDVGVQPNPAPGNYWEMAIVEVIPQ